MSAGPGDVTWLLVSLKSEDEQIAQIVEILRQLEIPARVVDPAALGERRRDPGVRLVGEIREAPAPEARRVTLRVPADRVVAAVLALEHHGFTRLRAYGGEAPAGS